MGITSDVKKMDRKKGEYTHRPHVITSPGGKRKVRYRKKKPE